MAAYATAAALALPNSVIASVVANLAFPIAEAAFNNTPIIANALAASDPFSNKFAIVEKEVAKLSARSK
jgi:hypothetical protein